MKARNERAERALFYSIWAVLILGFAIWKFRPHTEGPPAEVPITLAPEVRPWFSEGVVQRASGNAITIGLVLTPEYRKTLRNGSNPVNVHYRVSHPKAVASEGLTSVRLSPENSMGTALVNNPSREPATKIEFFLRH